MYVYVYTWMYMHMYMYTYMYKYMYTHIYMPLYMCTNMYLYVFMYMCMHMYLYVCIHVIEHCHSNTSFTNPNITPRQGLATVLTVFVRHPNPPPSQRLPVPNYRGSTSHVLILKTFILGIRIHEQLHTVGILGLKTIAAMREFPRIRPNIDPK